MEAQAAGFVITMIVLLGVIVVLGSSNEDDDLTID